MKSLDEMISKLKSPNLEERQEAIYNIHEIYQSDLDQVKSAIPIFQVIMNDPDWVMRKFSIKILGKLGVDDEIPRIIKSLESDPEVEVRVSLMFSSAGHALPNWS